MRVVIVEDQSMFREVVRNICTKELNYQVVGETHSGIIAIDIINRLQPDLVVLDLSLSALNGFGVLSKINLTSHSCRVMVLSCHSDNYTFYRIYKSKICGFMDKSTETLGTLIEGLKVFGSGAPYFSRSYLAWRQNVQRDPNALEKLLTNTECELLEGIVAGLNDAELGKRHQISAFTARTHRRNIMQKFGAESTPKLMAKITNNGQTCAP